jgi:hypothetical protein
VRNEGLGWLPRPVDTREGDEGMKRSRVVGVIRERGWLIARSVAPQGDGRGRGTGRGGSRVPGFGRRALAVGGQNRASVRAGVSRPSRRRMDYLKAVGGTILPVPRLLPSFTRRMVPQPMVVARGHKHKVLRIVGENPVGGR